MEIAVSGTRAAARHTVQYLLFLPVSDRIRKDEDVHSPIELCSDHISGGGDRHVMPSLSEQWDLLRRKLPLVACRMVTMDRNTPIGIYIELDSLAQPSSITTCNLLIFLEGEL